MMLSCSEHRAPEQTEPAPAETGAHEIHALAQAFVEHLSFERTWDAAPPDATAPRLLGEFDITYYWMARERGESAERDVPIYDKQCQPLATVSQAFAERLALEGTGQLRDGRTLNVAGTCQCNDAPTVCFFMLGRKKRWGVGVAKRPLSPYRSVAVNPETIQIGTKLYIPELDGLTMPGARPYGGFVHDGCVVADDTGGNVDSQQIDLFMALRVHYEAFDRRHRLKRIQVYDGSTRCQEPAAEGIPGHRNAT